MKLKLFFLVIIVFSVFKASSQENEVHNYYNNMLWGGYYNTIELNPKWAIATDAQIRTNNWQESLSQGLIRSGLNYKFNDKINATAGFAYFNYFITNSVSRNEYRPWQEVAINDKFWKLKITHRYRLEERFNQKTKNSSPINDYTFNYRFRYKLDFKIPFKKESEKGSNVYATVGNELMVNIGDKVSLNFFDQNRSYIGIHYELNNKLGLQIQYMRIWQQLAGGTSMNNINVLRFNIYHTITL